MGVLEVGAGLELAMGRALEVSFPANVSKLGLDKGGWPLPAAATPLVM